MSGTVTLDNWMRWPHSRTGYQHVRELIPTARIVGGTPGPWLSPAEPAEIDSMAAEPLDAFLERSHTDAIVMLHHGRPVLEEYRHGMGPDVPHLAMSVSKSITATAVGAVIGTGLLSPDAPVCEILPELAGTGMHGATVRHLLDMRTGTAEEITTLELQRRYYSAVLWAPAVGDGPVDEDSRSHFLRFRRSRPHGGDFEYRSTLTCVLAMAAERVTGLRLPELISRFLWRPMGAQGDADITVDRNGHPLADIGICCTVRDLARLGQLLLQRGRASDDRQVVPAPWVADTLLPDADQRAAFQANGRAFLDGDAAYYRNQWWVWRPRISGRDGIYLALGIHGQLLYIDEAASVVVAKFSSWTDAWDDGLARDTLSTCLRLAHGLSGQQHGNA